MFQFTYRKELVNQLSYLTPIFSSALVFPLSEGPSHSGNGSCKGIFNLQLNWFWFFGLLLLLGAHFMADLVCHSGRASGGLRKCNHRHPPSGRHKGVVGRERGVEAALQRAWWRLVHIYLHLISTNWIEIDLSLPCCGKKPFTGPWRLLFRLRLPEVWAGKFGPFSRFCRGVAALLAH